MGIDIELGMRMRIRVRIKLFGGARHVDGHGNRHANEHA